MKSIHFLGECMVELKASTADTMSQSFAGDVYNSAVYLKRCFSQISTSMVTAIGQDNFSNRMLAKFQEEEIDTQYVFRHSSKAPGIYLIETDASGERFFTYWRNDSAARKVLKFFDSDLISKLSTGDMFFFSGISLAAIEEGSREALWQTLESLKLAGVKLVFDPNYRARLWKSPDEAKEQFAKAFGLCDVALPGVEDLEELYGIDSALRVVEFFRTFELDELIIKNGAGSVVTYSQGTLLQHEIEPVTEVVDTTSAGDAFNGVYLGARLTDHTIAESVKLASKAAATVIQHHGAIIPKSTFTEAMAEYTR